MAREKAVLAATRVACPRVLAVRTDISPLDPAVVDGPELFPRLFCPGLLALRSVAKPLCLTRSPRGSFLLGSASAAIFALHLTSGRFWRGTVSGADFSHLLIGGDGHLLIWLAHA